jgi:tripartite-type tricarboxylate transporter receptor subunit TctC
LFAPAALALPLVRDGKLRALAVTSANGFSAAQDLPTIAESGVASFQFTTWNGLLAPANTPSDHARAAPGSGEGFGVRQYACEVC